jgi:TonB family protein
MKTKKSIFSHENMKFLLLLPSFLVIMIVFSIHGCGQKASKAETEVLPKPPLPPPPPEHSSMVCTTADEMPQFPDGEKGLMTYIMNNTVYPEKAKENKITGKVKVKFVVEKNCSVSKVEVIESVDPLLDAEAIRVVSSLPSFEKPAKKEGEPVSVEYTIPINFTLN